MTEEVRFFLRTAIYAAVIAAVYWFASFDADGVPLSYDPAGTTLLVFTMLGAVAVAGGMLVLVRGLRRGPTPGGKSGAWRIAAWANRVIGFDHSPADAEQPLAGGPDRIQPSSPWPVIAGLAATLLALGLVYGPWLTVPGIVLLAAATGGWLRQP